MIHQYKNNDIPIVLDVNSGSVHVVDAVVYDTVARMDEGKTLEQTLAELKESYDENRYPRCMGGMYGVKGTGDAVYTGYLRKCDRTFH